MTKGGLMAALFVDRTEFDRSSYRLDVTGSLAACAELPAAGPCCARWLSQTLPSTMTMPNICIGLSCWPSTAQPRMTAVVGLRKPSGDTMDGSSRDKPRNQRI